MTTYQDFNGPTEEKQKSNSAAHKDIKNPSQYDFLEKWHVYLYGHENQVGLITLVKDGR